MRRLGEEAWPLPEENKRRKSVKSTNREMSRPCPVRYQLPATANVAMPLCRGCDQPCQQYVGHYSKVADGMRLRA